MELYKISNKFFILVSLVLVSLGSAYSQTETAKVYIHYMGWYGDTVNCAENDSLRHWNFGHANQPVIGNYDSKSTSLITYHLLLSWACGIDGVVINVKDEYDHITMMALIRTINSIRGIDSTNFNYDFAISYDDQGFGQYHTMEVAVSKLCFLRDTILPNMTNYARYNQKPIIFSFDYPGKFLTAKEFRVAIDTVFKSNKPLLIWNTIEEDQKTGSCIDAYYPWVQPGRAWDKAHGLRWGKEYLDFYYRRVNELECSKSGFTCGGVWPGFDDRANISWGDHRFISRQEGKIYDSTWAYIHQYNGILPLKYVIIETWNDWNEGTEIEPSIEDGYRYLSLTIKHINKLKGTRISADPEVFEAAEAIYRAAFQLEQTAQKSDKEGILLNRAIASYLKKDFLEAMDISNGIFE